MQEGPQSESDPMAHPRGTAYSSVLPRSTGIQIQEAGFDVKMGLKQMGLEPEMIETIRSEDPEFYARYEDAL